MKKWLALLMSIVLTLSLAVPASAAAVEVPKPEKAHLSFNKDGKFTILQVADIQDNAVLSYFAKRAIVYAVEQAKPDLIVMTGDNIAGYNCKTKPLARAAIKQYMDVFEKLNVPVAMVFGNHDDDGTPYTKQEQIAQYETYSCFIGCEGVVETVTVGDKSSTNAGTYNIPIFASADSSDVAFNIWCFDSGNYNPDPAYGGYSYVFPEQVKWYVETSNALREANGGKPVPSFAFQHIIPPHIYSALKEVPAGTAGAVEHGGKYYVLPDNVDPKTNWLSESPCPPDTSFKPGYAQVDAMLEQGDVKAVFVGHDHVNSYVVPYKGIDLVSSPGITFSSYNDAHRGFRVITVDKANTDTYETYTLNAEELIRGGKFPDPFLYNFRALYEKAADFFEDLWNKIKSAF